MNDDVKERPSESRPDRGVVGGPSWRDVTITKVQNGFIIRVGCKPFVATSWEDVYEGLSTYWKDPVYAEEKYCI